MVVKYLFSLGSPGGVRLNIKIIKIIRWAAGGGIFIAVDHVGTEVLLSLSPGSPESLRE